MIDLPRSRTGLLSAALALVAVTPTFGEDAREVFDGMEARPYRVVVRVAFADAPALNAAVRTRTLESLRSTIASTFGSAWTAEVTADTSLPLATAADLERLVAADLAVEGEPAERPHKVFAVAASVAADGMVDAAAREWDGTVDSLGPVSMRRTGRLGQLGRTLFAALHDSYRPFGLLSHLENDQFRVRRPAAEFTLPDPTAASIGEGALLVPFLRYLDRKGVLQKVQPIAWTYLRVEGDEGLEVRGTVISGLRSPMGTKVLRRVQVVALLVRPRHASTRVRVATTNSPGTPAAGMKMRAVHKLKSRDEGDGEPLELMTDRMGHITLARSDEHPITWLYAHSGAALLARVPIAVGVLPEMSFLVPDDRPRLLVEGRMQILQADLIDAVATRETLIRRIRIHKNKPTPEWEKIDDLVADLRRLPTAKDFEQRLATIQSSPVAEARADNNPRAVFGIGKLVDKTRERIRRFVDEDRVNELLDTLAEDRKLDMGDIDVFGP